LAKNRRFNVVSLPADPISIRCQVEPSDRPFEDDEIAKAPGLKQ
jgi:hypothetical protein